MSKEDFFFQWFLDDCENCNHDLDAHERHCCTETIVTMGPADNMDMDEYPCECGAFVAHQEIHWEEHEHDPWPSDCPCCDECDAEAYAEEATW